ncbi:MAG: Gfo/Idh/MocA family oxidoreductase [Candidatus Saccharimonas sp.]|nr:Gfo/Idh/MocA family oxidoreductase [Planctomycetaceae bacterium]
MDKTSTSTTSTSNGGVTRRELLKTSGQIVAASALAGIVLPQHVYAGETSTVKLALIGAGGRGTGAAENALQTKLGPVKLAAMADVFPERLKLCHKTLSDKFKEKVDVPQDRQFLGFDAYKNAMDCLNKGDVVILTTPCAFRWVHFGYAISKGLNVFMEKPTTVDGPSTRKMLALYEESMKKNLKVGVGLMCRHCEARGELFKRIQDGQIGDIVMLRAYRCHGPVASAFSKKKPENMSELMYQINRFHSFLFLSGGCFSDFLIHNIDESCWMKNSWPVEAKGFGGRHYRGDYVDQNFDVYTTEYTFDDGAKFFMEGRCMEGANTEFASYVHGTKGSAVISQNGHWPSGARIFKGQKMIDSEVVWRGEDKVNPYQGEWENLMNAIRQDKPYNEAKRGAEASLVTSMGRMACHTGRVITYDEILNSDHEFAPNVDQLVIDGPSPLPGDADGKYPVPAPGITKKREY